MKPAKVIAHILSLVFFFLAGQAFREKAWILHAVYLSLGIALIFLRYNLDSVWTKLKPRP